MKKFPRAVFAVLFLLTAIVVGFIRPTVAEETMYIRSNGMVDPPTAPISPSADNITYYLTNNILGRIVVQRDNIVVDGAGYTIQGAQNGTGIDLTGRHNVTIENIEIKAFAFGIRLYLSSKITISGNNITSNDYGIKLEGSSNNIISRNNITNIHRGIWLQGSPNNTLSGNNITNNNQGIYLENSSANTLSGNNVTANNYHGIGLFGSSDNTLSGNNVTANTAEGIWLYDSSSNIISGNNITSNDYGIQLYDSSNNIIYNNSFVDNAEQVFSAGSTNIWDNGYPSGGNYWSNYTDVDQYSGPYQNETGSDEIWDNPYVIDEYNVDNYPLVPEFPTKASTLLILTVLAVAIGIHKRTLPNTLARV